MQCCWSNRGIRPRRVCGSSHCQRKGLGEWKSHGVKSGCVLLMLVLHDLTKSKVRALMTGKDPLLAFSSSGWLFSIIWFSSEERGTCFDFLGGSFHFVPSCVQASCILALSHVNAKLILSRQQHYPCSADTCVGPLEIIHKTSYL